MVFDVLRESNFILYAMHHYENQDCHSLDDFLEDLNRIKYVKRLINRYLDTGVLKERLILNHLTILSNVFGPIHMRRLLFLRLNDGGYSVLKTFLWYMNLMPERVEGVEKKVIEDKKIPLDKKVKERLESL